MEQTTGAAGRSDDASSAGDSPGSRRCSGDGPGSGTGSSLASQSTEGPGNDPYVRQVRALECDLLDKLHELRLVEVENRQLTKRYAQLELQVGISSQHLLHIARVCCQPEAATTRATATAGTSSVASELAPTPPPAPPDGGDEAAPPGVPPPPPEGQDALQVVLEREQQVQALLQSVGIALPHLGAGAIRLQDILAGMDLEAAAAMTLEELVDAHKAFVQQASLLLHQSGPPSQTPRQQSPELHALVTQHLRLMMAVASAQPLLTWRLASIDLETMRAQDMPVETYRYVVMRMSLSWEQLDWLAGAYAHHESQLQQLTDEKEQLLEALAAATAVGNAAAEAEAVAAVQRNVRQWNQVQNSVSAHLAAVSCCHQLAELMVRSYPYVPLALYVSLTARDLVREITQQVAEGPEALGPDHTDRCKAQWAALCHTSQAADLPTQ